MPRCFIRLATTGVFRHVQHKAKQPDVHLVPAQAPQLPRGQATTDKVQQGGLLCIAKPGQLQKMHADTATCMCACTHSLGQYWLTCITQHHVKR